jgi:flagellar basal body P-ring formation protein FlgA
MIRAIIALVMLAALGGEASTQSAVRRLKEVVTVNSDVVRIGDLVENAGAAADIPVFRAPDLGHTGLVPVSRIAEALRPYDLAGMDTGGLIEVVVTRPGRIVTGKEIAGRIAQAFAGQFGFGEAQDLSVILDRDIRTLQIELAGGTELIIVRLHADPRTGRFDATFEMPGSSTARRRPLRLTGTLVETVEVATLTRAVRPGDVIKASDVQMDRRPKAEIGNDAMGLDRAIGLAAKNALRSGHALRATDLIKPQAVQRNEPVTIIFEVPGILLTVRGKALEAGAVGEVINVLNTQSNRTVQATIAGPGRVVIAATMPLLTSAVAPALDAAIPSHTQ